MALPPIPFAAQVDRPLPAAQPDIEGMEIDIPELNTFENGVEIIEQPDGGVILREPVDEALVRSPTRRTSRSTWANGSCSAFRRSCARPIRMT